MPKLLNIVMTFLKRYRIISQWSKDEDNSIPYHFEVEGSFGPSFKLIPWDNPNDEDDICIPNIIVMRLPLMKTICRLI
jgi:hypothetical protein